MLKRPKQEALDDQRLGKRDIDLPISSTIQSLQDKVNVLEEELLQINRRHINIPETKKLNPCACGKPYGKVTPRHANNSTGLESDSVRKMTVSAAFFDTIESRFNFNEEPEYEYQVSEAIKEIGPISKVYLNLREGTSEATKRFLIEIDHGAKAEESYSIFMQLPMVSGKLSSEISRLNSEIAKVELISKLEGPTYKEVVETCITVCSQADWPSTEANFAPVDKFIMDNDMSQILQEFNNKEDHRSGGDTLFQRAGESCLSYDLTRRLDNTIDTGINIPSKILGSDLEQEILRKRNKDLQDQIEILTHRLSDTVKKVQSNEIAMKYEKEIKLLRTKMREMQYISLNKDPAKALENHDKKIIESIRSCISANIGIKWVEETEVLSVSYLAQEQGKSRYKFNILLAARHGSSYELILIDKTDPYSRERPSDACLYKQNMSGHIMDINLGTTYHIAAVGEPGIDSRILIYFGTKDPVILRDSFKPWMIYGEKRVKVSKQGTVIHIDNGYLYFVTLTDRICYIDLESDKLVEEYLDIGGRSRIKIQAITVLEDCLYVAAEDGTIHRNDIAQGMMMEYEENAMLITSMKAFDKYLVYSTYGDEYREGNDVYLHVIGESLEKRIDSLNMEKLGNCIIKNLVISVPRTIRSCFLILSLPYCKGEMMGITMFNSEKLQKITTMDSWWQKGCQINDLCFVGERVLLSSTATFGRRSISSPLAILKLFESISKT